MKAPDLMAVSQIRIGERVRKDMGDIGALAESIRVHGLLHPPAITSDGVLIAGHRRIAACISLGMDSVPVRIIDVADLLAAERDENQVRKDFTPSEAVAIARTIEAELKMRANANRSVGAKARWRREKGEKVNSDETSEFTSVDVRTSAAAVTGMCEQRFSKAKQVVEAAEQDAEQFGDIVEMMDSTGNVYGAHTEMLRRRENSAVRHPILRKMHHRDPNREIERAITSLTGLAMGIEKIDATGLDPVRLVDWVAELKGQMSVINRFIRSINHECSK